MKDSAEKVKQALKEAQKAQTAASSAIRQATADIKSTTTLLSSVSPQHCTNITFTPVLSLYRSCSDCHLITECFLSVAFRWSRRL